MDPKNSTGRKQAELQINATLHEKGMMIQKQKKKKHPEDRAKSHKGLSLVLEPDQGTLAGVCMSGLHNCLGAVTVFIFHFPLIRTGMSIAVILCFSHHYMLGIVLVSALQRKKQNQ